MYVNMNVARMLSKINEYKGRQLLYKTTKRNFRKLRKKSLVDCSESTYIGNQRDSSNFNLEKLISNEVTPRSREELSIVEYRDVVKLLTVLMRVFPSVHKRFLSFMDTYINFHLLEEEVISQIMILLNTI